MATTQQPVAILAQMQGILQAPIVDVPVGTFAMRINLNVLVPAISHPINTPSQVMEMTGHYIYCLRCKTEWSWGI